VLHLVKRQMTVKTLRPYQQRAFDELRKAVADGHKRILLVIPTGGGKSVVFSKVISSANDKGNPVVFLVHKRELVHQASGHLENEQVHHAIIMAGEPQNQMASNQICSKDTLYSRIKNGKMKPPRAKLMVIDEAHRTGSSTYNHILDAEEYENTIIIGVTATPTRKTGRGLADQWDKMIVVTTVAELQEMGFLCQTRYMVPAIPDLSGVSSSNGDYVDEQLQKIMDDKTLIGNIVDHWLKYAGWRQTIVFASGVGHSKHLRDHFTMHGVVAAHIDAHTEQGERDQIHDDFAAGKITVLCNVGIYTEGVDMPNVGCIVLAKPTKSIVYHLQAGGRGLRLKEDGSDCLIIDHAGNVLRLGPMEMDHEWSLEDEKTVYERDGERQASEDEKEHKETEYICGKCGNIFISQPTCPTCGEPIVQTGKKLEVAQGELTLYKPKKAPKQPASKLEKQRFWSMLLWRAEKKSYQRGWASHKYKEKFGVWPKGMVDERLPPDFEFDKYIKYLNIKAAKSRQARA